MGTVPGPGSSTLSCIKLRALSWAQWHLFLPAEVRSSCEAKCLLGVVVVVGVLFKICRKANGLGPIRQGIINQYITYVTDEIGIGSMAWV